jgi:hypothetical protein
MASGPRFDAARQARGAAASAGATVRSSGWLQTGVQIIRSRVVCLRVATGRLKEDGAIENDAMLRF